MGSLTRDTDVRGPIASRDDAEAYVARICFKHGPPARVGVELEWTVHHTESPDRPLDPATLSRALGDHAPPTLTAGRAGTPLPQGSQVTVEPGGQVELSSSPFTSLTALVDGLDRDIAALDALLVPAGLRRGEAGIDAHRHQPRLLSVPRYAAMQSFFDRIGPWGAAMMCRTASTQVCLDAGEQPDLALRWRALHLAGPALVALFANSPVVAGRDTGWASNRLRATLGTCPPVTSPPALTDDPTAAWVARAMSAPVICVRRDGDCWDPPTAMTFAGWLAGTHAPAPTYDDLDYHLSTLFPPVRPRGYVEVRYLDAQPTDRWHHPVLLLATLMADRRTVDKVVELAEPTGDRWWVAARDGLRDAALRATATALVELAGSRLDTTGGAGDLTGPLLETLHRRTAETAARRQPA